MAKFRNPVQFSDYYNIDRNQMENLGVLDPTLNVDTRLFIDPLLLKHSCHPEIKRDAASSYRKHFSTVIKLIKASKRNGDSPWRNAFRLLKFPEVKWTCLGYGSQSVSGRGSGTELTSRILHTAKEIIDLGVDDPDLFVVMALFEEGFGADRICDMTANVLIQDLVKFSARILQTIGVKTEHQEFDHNGKKIRAHLTTNPYLKEPNPIILVPTDILRHLPIAIDRSEIADAASFNEVLRRTTNKDIAQIWTENTLKNKRKLRNWVLSQTNAFEALLACIKDVHPRAYDIEGDPRGELFWRKLVNSLPSTEPFELQSPRRLDSEGVAKVVEQIIKQFQFLIEERRLSEELYDATGKPRPERSAQRLFFAVAYAYCKANDADLTPEADTGNGPVDFKISSGFTGRVLVEIKLSTNSKLLKGYKLQLEKYRNAEETHRAYYIVIDVGGMGSKDQRLFEERNDAVARQELPPKIMLVNGIRKASASKL